MKQNALPTVLVIFGATGDLMGKKIVPALFELFRRNELPKLFQVIGVARRPLTSLEFTERIRSILVKYHLDDDTELVDAFLHRFAYHSGRFEESDDYTKLAQWLGQIDGEWKTCSNKLFYLAVPPKYYETIFEHLASSGLTIPCGPDEGWTRVIVEKPFGDDLSTAERLDQRLGELFREEQIFRIDHYLAKEMLQNILAFRFSNNLFETTWDNSLIEKIDIYFWETLGVEDRGAFYDGVGALRDVGQNHLLQILALLTMDRPDNFSADAVRRRRAEILHTLELPNPQVIPQTTTRAQYTGYQTIEGVEPTSQTETYFRIPAKLTHPRWQGVPITMEGGKRIGTLRKEVVVTLRHPAPCLCPPGNHYQNRVTFTLEPEERITIHFWAKKPGLRMDMEERTLDFLYRPGDKRSQYVEEYMKLLLDCLLGDQLLFVSTEEIQAMWRFIDPIIRSWQAGETLMQSYPPDTIPALTAQLEVITPPIKKELAIVGLGKMGAGLARQLTDKNWRVVGYNRTTRVTEELAKEGIEPITTLADLATRLAHPRIVWVMVPAGEAVDEMLFGKAGLIHHLEPGDIIIDGGNSYYEDTQARAKKLLAVGLRFLDVGTSGGPAGARHGASLMIGGNSETFRQAEPIFRDVAIPRGYQFFEGAGAGHFVKMVHNGIEYGMMQAIAEGFAIMQASDYKLDLSRVADIYNHGSVIESRLIAWLGRAFTEHGAELTNVTSTVAHTGEGAWTVETAEKLGIPADIIAGALEFRKQSAANPSFAGKILSALRGQFGGHSIK